MERKRLPSAILPPWRGRARLAEGEAEAWGGVLLVLNASGGAGCRPRSRRPWLLAPDSEHVSL